MSTHRDPLLVVPTDAVVVETDADPGSGEPVGGSGSLTELRLELGSLLSPVGATIPPRTFSTRLIGAGCRL